MESLNGKNCRKGFVFDLSIVTFVIPKWSWRMSHRVPCWVGYGSVVLFSKGTFCSRRSPNAAELATIFKLVSTLELKILRYWVLLISNFSFPIVPSWDFSNLNSTYFFSSVRRRKVTSERFGMIFLSMWSCFWIDAVRLQSLAMAFSILPHFLLGKLLDLQMI